MKLTGFISNVGGGGIMFFLHFMLFQTFLEKINSGNKKKYIYNLMFFSCDFCGGGGWC